MRKSLLICIGILVLLLVAGATALFSMQDKNKKPSKIEVAPNESVIEPASPKPLEKELPAVSTQDRDIQMPVFREAVIVYFKKTPVSLEDFASKYGGKLIFTKQDIKMAVFETNTIGRSGETSQRTLDFINEVSKDPLVEKAYKDGFMFTRADKVYLPQAEIIYPENYDQEGIKYVPNKVIVGFWRLPSSLVDFASKYNATLKSADDVLLFAAFETDNVSGFIKNVSTNPYIRYAHPDTIGSII